MLLVALGSVVFAGSAPIEVLGTHAGWGFGKQCSADRCDAVVGRVLADGTLASPVVLAAPAPGWVVDGIELEKLSLVDVNGDGIEELRVDWTHQTTPRAALGSVRRLMVTVVSTTSGGEWATEMVSQWGASVERRCLGEVKLDAAGLHVTQKCGEAGCLDGIVPAERCGEPESVVVRSVVWAPSAHSVGTSP